jgi:hypothetical protein
VAAAVAAAVAVERVDLDPRCGRGPRLGITCSGPRCLRLLGRDLL